MAGKKKQHQAIKNLTAVLEAAGTNINNVVKVNVFIDDMANFAAMNEVRRRNKHLQPPPFFSSLSLMIKKNKKQVYTTYWGENKPCRTCVAAKQLPLGTDVEIECIAVLP